MDDDPTYRSQDLAALVADVLLPLLSDLAPNERHLSIVDELVSVCERLVEQDLLGDLPLVWVAALESARGPHFRSAAERRRSERRAAAALERCAEMELPSASDWRSWDVPDCVKVAHAAAVLAITAGPARRLLSPSAFATELSAQQNLACWAGSDRLRAAVVFVAQSLDQANPSGDCRLGPSSPLDSGPVWEQVGRLVADGRADVLVPPLVRGALDELRDLTSSNQNPLRSVEILEALAIVDCWPLLASGPPTGWGEVRGDPVFDSLFMRAALIGAGPRTGQMVWRDVGAPTAGTTIWLREADAEFRTLFIAWTDPDGSAHAELVSLPANLGHSIRELARGNAGGATAATMLALGDHLVARVDAHIGDLPLLSIVPSPSLRSVPFEAFQLRGSALIERGLVTVAPCHSLPIPEGPTRPFGEAFKVLGLFDRSLPGVQQEIEALRALVKSNDADGRAYEWSPRSIRDALVTERWDLLTIGAHGASTLGVPTLELPRGSIGVPQLLEWQMPRNVCLAACRTAQNAPTRVPVDLILACLRRGATSVVAARWAVPDHSTGRIIASVYAGMAQRHLPMSLALRTATLEERRRNEHPWFWAGLGLFGSP